MRFSGESRWATKEISIFFLPVFQIVVLGAVTPDFVDDVKFFFCFRRSKTNPWWPRTHGPSPSPPSPNRARGLTSAAPPSLQSPYPGCHGPGEILSKTFVATFFCRFWRFCTKNPLKLQNQIFQSLGCFHHKCKKSRGRGIVRICSDKSLYETRPRLWDCGNSSRLCRHEGVLSEVMDVLAGMFNFTYTVDADPGGDWGVVPVKGSFEDEGSPLSIKDF